MIRCIRFMLLVSIYSLGCIYIATIQKVLANTEVLVVHQARGSSCCDKGNIEHTRQQIAEAQRLQIPIAIALRYDALQDSAYQKLFKEAIAQSPQLITPAAFLEIIPQWAHDAGVNYSAKPENWYKAEHAYTPGYALADRDKLIDAYMKVYQDVFGAYPVLTVGWILDTHTLGRLHQKYGVVVHEITREQSETDSYSLQGCPWHYPYPASNMWACIPDYSAKDGLMIVRQTLTDPLFNYGDTSSSFTGQPNDYVRGKRDFAYFMQLVDAATQSANKLHPGYITLGIENSMDAQFQNEFTRQITYLKENIADVQFVGIVNIEKWRKRPLTTIQRTQDGKTAWNITTPRYRVRVIYDQTQKMIAITDMRSYDIAWHDPFDTRQIRNGAYWVVPAVVDASKWRNASGVLPLSTQNDFQSLLVMSEHILAGKSAMAPVLREMSDALVLQNDTMQIYFEQQHIRTTHSMRYNTTTHPLQLRTVRVSKQSAYNWSVSGKAIMTPAQLTHICNKRECTLTINPINAKTLTLLRNELYPWYYPENDGWKIHEGNSTMKPFNRFAIAGRNPIVLTIVPRDRFMQPIHTDNAPRIGVDSDDIFHIQKRKIIHYLADIYATKPGIVNVTAEYTGNRQKLKTWVVFAPNCKKDIVYCATHPHHALLYVGAMIEEKFFTQRKGR